MKQVQVNFPEELFHNLKMKEAEFSYEIKKIALLKLFELGKISSGKAAQYLGISRIDFIELLSEYGISIFNDDVESYLGSDVENAIRSAKNNQISDFT